MSVTRGLLLSPLLCLLAAAGALAQPVGPEFRVNTFTTYGQEDPAVASDAFGNFVVIWDSWGADGSKSGIFGQRYDSDGDPLGGEFQVNTFTTDEQDYPSLASDASGNFVVVWRSLGQDGSIDGIFGQRYDSHGNPLGGEFRVNTYSTGSQRYPSVASDASGNFVVVWASEGQDGSRFGVFGQRYDSQGNLLGGQFRVNAYTTSYQRRPAVASDAGGDFVVIWESWGADGSKLGIFGQRYDSQGNLLGGEFQVNAYTTSYQGYPAVASDASGNFVVVWWSYGQDGSYWGVFGRRYDSHGNPVGGDFQVNTFTTGAQLWPSIASDAVGNFVVVWEERFGQDGSINGIFGQRYDSHGNRVGDEFQVNTWTINQQESPAVASDASGNFVIVWDGDGAAGQYADIFGQRFSAACEASVQVKGDIHTPGSTLPVRIHIAHNSPETVTVPWQLSLIDPDGRVLAERVTPPHTFEPGDVVDVEMALPLPENLEAGTYALRLGIGGMAGTEGATTSFRVAEPKPTTSARPF